MVGLSPSRPGGCRCVVFTCVGPAGLSLFQVDREIERAVSCGRKGKDIFLSAVQKEKI